MIRIKMTIQNPATNKAVKAYIRDDYGMIMAFSTKAEAQAHIDYIQYCDISVRDDISYNITGK